MSNPIRTADADRTDLIGLHVRSFDLLKWAIEEAVTKSPQKMSVRHDREPRDHFRRDPYPSNLEGAAGGLWLSPRREPVHSRALAKWGRTAKAITINTIKE